MQITYVTYAQATHDENMEYDGLVNATLRTLNQYRLRTMKEIVMTNDLKHLRVMEHIGSLKNF